MLEQLTTIINELNDAHNLIAYTIVFIIFRKITIALIVGVLFTIAELFYGHDNSRITNALNILFFEIAITLKRQATGNSDIGSTARSHKRISK